VTDLYLGVISAYTHAVQLLNTRRGLDSRYMISQLRPTDFKILSLTTIATPHRGSAFADYMFETIGRTSVILLECFY